MIRMLLLGITVTLLSGCAVSKFDSAQSTGSNPVETKENIRQEFGDTQTHSTQKRINEETLWAMGVGFIMASDSSVLEQPGLAERTAAVSFCRYFARTLRYPLPAYRLGLEGTVMLKVVITCEGTIGEIFLKSSHPRFEEAVKETVDAMRAVWCSQPLEQDIIICLPVKFEIPFAKSNE